MDDLLEGFLKYILKVYFWYQILVWDARWLLTWWLGDFDGFCLWNSPWFPTGRERFTSSDHILRIFAVSTSVPFRLSPKFNRSNLFDVAVSGFTTQYICQVFFPCLMGGFPCVRSQIMLPVAFDVEIPMLHYIQTIWPGFNGVVPTNPSNGPMSPFLVLSSTWMTPIHKQVTRLPPPPEFFTAKSTVSKSPFYPNLTFNSEGDSSEKCCSRTSQNQKKSQLWRCWFHI